MRMAREQLASGCKPRSSYEYATLEFSLAPIQRRDFPFGNDVSVFGCDRESHEEKYASAQLARD
jgi:hypothetical protein